MRLFRNETQEWYHVYAAGEEIICTAEHPFYVDGKGFVPARELKERDNLLLSDGSKVEIDSLRIEYVDIPETTYNFEVKDFHTYYVSKEKVLVHNFCLAENVDYVVKYYENNKVYKAYHQKSGMYKGKFIAKDNYGHGGSKYKLLKEISGKRLELIDNDVFQFCWIIDFPMFELDEHDNIAFSHNPFSMPQGGLDALENQNPLDILAYQYDIVCNGIELSSGAVRNHDINIMLKAFTMAGYTEEEVKTKFGALYTAFQFGAPPHAGIAPGIDRMLMLLSNSETIREVIAFPLNSKAEDLMMGAPGNVRRDQLRDVHISKMFLGTDSKNIQK